MTTRPTIRNAGQGRTIGVVGDVYSFLVTGDETGGKYALWEAIVPPGGGPPPHVHSREEEGFYILEGQITIQVGQQRIVASAGMFANMPVGTQHSFKNESNQPARMLISVAPAGLEKMFFEIGTPLPKGSHNVPAAHPGGDPETPGGRTPLWDRGDAAEELNVCRVAPDFSPRSIQWSHGDLNPKFHHAMVA
jgi:quercetin dioxygenase-like cupin family protein